MSIPMFGQNIAIFSQKMWRTCAVLHNLHVLKNDEADEEMQDEKEDGDEEGGKNEENDNPQGLAKRRSIVYENFN
uniref:DDE Tnp4 domain-containing protein n=1 Tax=Romanomermis culicivorax TaxID=13658 RepID=A0A915IY23_ROMCU